MASLGHPCKFQRVSRLGFVTAATPFNGSQPNFAQCLALTWAGRLHFRLLIRDGILPGAKFTLRPPSLALSYLQRYCTVVAQWARAKLCGVEHRAPPIFGRATIRLGIGPHSSWSSFVTMLRRTVSEISALDGCSRFDIVYGWIGQIGLLLDGQTKILVM